jgi:hypothetical protein
MHYIILKSLLFNRWRVYEMGHLEGRRWLATFRNAQDAAAWKCYLSGTLPPTQGPDTSTNRKPVEFKSNVDLSEATRSVNSLYALPVKSTEGNSIRHTCSSQYKMRELPDPGCLACMEGP